MKQPPKQNAKTTLKSTNASIFIPHLGCPHECSFCDKNAITEESRSVTKAEIREILASHVKSLTRRNMTAEIAFFGGTFTALDCDYRESLLKIANEFMADSDVFTGIRCSTRPDARLTADNGQVTVLEQLRKYNVTAIELGAQSMDDEVLAANNRGHSAVDVRKAAKLIKSYGFELGLQMMTGLYKDSVEKSLYTADELIKLKPDTIRIYPTEVFPGTRLHELRESGIYTEFSRETTIELCAEIYGRFVENGVRVIRLGLNSPRLTFPANVTGELAISRYYFRRMVKFMQESGGTKFKIFTDKRNISKICGHKGENRLKLAELGFDFRVKEKPGTDLEIVRV